MLRAVIFDMDGTLLDSEIIHYEVIRAIIERCLEYDISVEEYMKYCGVPDAQMWPEILVDLAGRHGRAGIREQFIWCSRAAQRMQLSVPLSDGPEETLKSLKSGNNDMMGRLQELQNRICGELERLHWLEYDEYIEKKGVQGFPGMRKLLNALCEAGVKIGVGTGSLRRIVEHNLDLLQIRPYISAAATSEDCENGKPAPDVFLKAAEYLKVEPSACLVVEDAANGLLAAERAGMCRAAFTGSRIPSRLPDEPAVFSDYRKVTPETFFHWYAEQTATIN